MIDRQIDSAAAASSARSGDAPQIDSPAATRNTILLQCLATVLIANSHLEAFYPRTWMAADGLLGNSMFFLLSGYGLMCSEWQRPRPFHQYYLRRVLRIYPSLFLTMAIFQVGLRGDWRVWSVGDYFRHFVYPTSYEFIRQIMVYYVVFYLLARLRRPQLFLWLAALLCIPYALFYGSDLQSGRTASLMLGALSPEMWWVFFFQVMLLGGWLAGTQQQSRLNALKGPRLMLILAFGAYVALKFAMVKAVRTPCGLLFNFYPALHLLTVLILILAFIVGCAPATLNLLKRVRPLFWMISLAGGLTLEIYLVHPFVFRDERVAHIVFPVNVIVFFALSICLSWAVARFADWIRQQVGRRISIG